MLFPQAISASFLFYLFSILIDVLKARQKTTIITETHFKIDERSFVFIDVGGQQQFRYQWTRFFDDCKAIIFVASISCFDQVLEENEAINRFEDTMDLFEQVCNNEILRAVAIILFLNKVDLLTEKIVRNPGIVKKRFPEFIGE